MQNRGSNMTAAIARTHRQKWMKIHQKGCAVLHINPDRETERFMELAESIARFTDEHNHPPRTGDIQEMEI